MQPRIEGTDFGSITIAHEDYEHDVIIHLNGEVEKRKKKLSKALYGTSHIVSLAEARQKKIIRSHGCSNHSLEALQLEDQDGQQVLSKKVKHIGPNALYRKRDDYSGSNGQGEDAQSFSFVIAHEIPSAFSIF